jgi:CheY-like chemotaxis protein
MNSSNKILVVDDEEDVRVYLSRLFRENGYSVTSAADGNEAAAAVAKDRPDLITLDLSMPHTSGVRFYRDIRADRSLSGIPIVMVTGVTGLGGSSKDTERFYSTRRNTPPPDGFVAKPVDPEEILALVKRLIGGREQ